MEVTEFGMVTEVNPIQPSKADPPMDETELGITVFMHPKSNLFVALSIMALQLSLLSKTLFPEATAIEVRLPQEEKADSPMKVTELPIVMEVKLVQPENALDPI